MIAFVLIGFIAIIFSFSYLIYHFINKTTNKERTISKKIFYPNFLGGLVFFIIGIIGISFIDTGVHEKLEEALKENEQLVALLKSLESKKEELENQVIQLEANIDETTNKIAEYENQLESFEDDKVKIESMTEQINNLTMENDKMNREIQELESKLASAQAAASAAMASNSSNGNSNSNASGSSSSNASVYYKNCSAARAAGAAPVYKGDPGYGTHLDRDGDGIGCE